MVYNIRYLVQFLPSQKLCKWAEVLLNFENWVFVPSHVIDGAVKVFGMKQKNKPCTLTELHLL